MQTKCPCCEEVLPTYFHINEEERIQWEEQKSEAGRLWERWKQEQSHRWPLFRFFSRFNELSFFGFVCVVGGILSIFAIRYWWPETWGDRSTAEGLGVLFIAGWFLLTRFSDWYIMGKVRTSFEEMYPQYRRLIK